MIFRPIPRQKSSNSLSDLCRVFELMREKGFFQGEGIRAFETEFAQAYGVRHALATGSCRSAFSLALDALGIQSGDEVILPAFNMPAFPKILRYKGIKPVFVDIHERTLNIDETLIEEKITARTRAIVAVHLFGNTCPMDRIMTLARKHRLVVIEDCANAFNTPYQERLAGTYGDVACFSLGSTKDIPTWGGGVIITNDSALFSKCVDLYERNFVFPSWTEVTKNLIKGALMQLLSLKFSYLLLIFPMNLFCSLVHFDPLDYVIEEKDREMSCLPQKKYTNFQALIGINKFQKSRFFQEKRGANARILNDRLSECPAIVTPGVLEGGSHAYWNYPLLVPCRRPFVRALLRHGIGTKTIDTYDCNGLDIFREYRQMCPKTEEVAQKILVLPVYHHLNKNDVEFMAAILKKTYSKLALQDRGEGCSGT